MLQFGFESSNKNRILDMSLGAVGGVINGAIALSIILSMLFYSYRIDDTTIQHLNKSIAFKNIYLLKTTFIDYAK